jgi:hypothetical protein
MKVDIRSTSGERRIPDSERGWYVSPWEYAVWVDDHLVGKMGLWKDGLDEGYSIGWVIDIPPTNFATCRRGSSALTEDQARTEARRFARLFAETHADRLVRASRSPAAIKRIHSNTDFSKSSVFYQLGITVSIGEHGKRGTLLDFRGERLEVLFYGTSEPVIYRNTNDDVWRWYRAHSAHWQLAGNEKRAEHASARKRDRAGRFTTQAHTKPSPRRTSTTGHHVGQGEVIDIDDEEL